MYQNIIASICNQYKNFNDILKTNFCSQQSYFTDFDDFPSEGELIHTNQNDKGLSYTKECQFIQ